MEKVRDTIQEEREALMDFPAAEYSATLRKTRFLRPISNCIDEAAPSPPSSETSASQLKELSKKVLFNWKYPKEKWKQWVQNMRPNHEPTWKRAGISEAVLSSTYEIKQHKNIVLGVAQKWKSETNSFVFPWGEATISLEDVMISGGFSVLGESVLSPLTAEELVGIRFRLIELHRVARTKNSTTASASYAAWMDYFMGTGHELEHEAFLSFWLSKFVLVNLHSTRFVSRHVFPVAIRIARGIRIALGTAVLSSIYRDMGLMEKHLFGLTNEVQNGNKLLALFAPLQLVQLWIWERFPVMRPWPNLISCGEPRVARWHRLHVRVDDVKKTIDSAEESFQWRPYCLAVKNWDFPKFYGDEEQWIITSNSHLDEEFESFARCLRPSELVGIGCLEQYLPHRVAMQFGFNQDIPGFMVRCDGDPGVAWNNYTRPIEDEILYIPPRLLEADVTKQYSDWWNAKGSASTQCDAIKPYVKKPRSSSRTIPVSARREEYYNLIPSTGYPFGPQAVGSRGGSIKGSELMSLERSWKEEKTCIKQPFPNLAMDKEAIKMELDDKKMAMRIEIPAAKLEIETENVTESDKGFEGKETIYNGCPVELPKLELEDRICRLERIVCKLKAKRSK